MLRDLLLGPLRGQLEALGLRLRLHARLEGNHTCVEKMCRVGNFGQTSTDVSIERIGSIENVRRTEMR